MSEIELRHHLKWTAKKSHPKNKRIAVSDPGSSTGSRSFPCTSALSASWSNTSPPFRFQDSEWQLELWSAGMWFTDYRVVLKKLDSKPVRPFQTTCFAQCQPHVTGVSVLVTNHKPGELLNFKIWTEEFLPRSSDFFSMDSIVFVVNFDGENNGTPFELDTDTGDKCTNAVVDLAGLSSDFGDLLASGETSDVQLKCEGVTRPAHRSVLSARSEVFSAMFRIKMAESASGVVDIQDLDAALLDLLLEYVYTGKLQDIPAGRMHELYAVADKYAVDTLKKTCCDWMIRNLSETNYLAFLSTAANHDDKELQEALMESISDQPEWLKSGTWFQFAEEHHELGKEVYRMLYDKARRRVHVR